MITAIGAENMRWKNYHIMRNIQETITRLAERPGQARVVAGGTDLIVQMMEKESQEEFLTLLDISQIEEIRGIKESEGYLFIGAVTNMAEVAASALIQKKARALAQGACCLGSPQIRNMATIGGNVVNAQPAADTAVPLIALAAEARIISLEAERYVPVEELFLGVSKSVVNPFQELITHFRVPLCEGPRRASAIQRLAKRKVFTLPTLLVSVSLELNEIGDRFYRVRIVAAPVAPVPWRARRAEEFLKDAAISEENIKQAAVIASEDANPRDSLRGSATYRKEMVEVLTRRALVDALSQLNKVLYD